MTSKSMRTVFFRAPQDADGVVYDAHFVAGEHLESDLPSGRGKIGSEMIRDVQVALPFSRCRILGREAPISHYERIVTRSMSVSTSLKP